MDTSFNNELLVNLFWVWLSVFYLLPNIVMIIITSVNPRMSNLNGLVLNPQMDTQNNVLSVDSNYEEFINSIPISARIKKYSITVKIFKIMCDDARHGRKYHPDLYLLLLRKTHDRFFSLMLLFSFFPVVITLIFNGGTILNNLHIFLLVQLLCVGLVFLINIIHKSRYTKFYEFFYKTLYDKILNFDVLAIKHIETNIQKDISIDRNSALSEMVSKFAGMNIALEDSIKNSTSLLTDKLSEFINLKNAGRLASYQDIIDSIQSGIEKAYNFSTSYEQIHGSINTALSGIGELVSAQKLDTEAINNNAALLKEIRDEFSNYREKAYHEELTQLEKITKSLNTNIENTFTAVEAALNRTTQSLGDSYDRFFDMSTKFNKAYSANIDLKQIADALLVLMQENKKLDEWLKKGSLDVSEDTCQ